MATNNICPICKKEHGAESLTCKRCNTEKTPQCLQDLILRMNVCAKTLTEADGITPANVIAIALKFKAELEYLKGCRVAVLVGILVNGKHTCLKFLPVAMETRERKDKPGVFAYSAVHMPKDGCFYTGMVDMPKCFWVVSPGRDRNAESIPEWREVTIEAMINKPSISKVLAYLPDH